MNAEVRSPAPPRRNVEEGLKRIAAELKIRRALTVKSPTDPVVVGFWLEQLLGALEPRPLLVTVADELIKLKLTQSLAFWARQNKTASSFTICHQIDSRALYLLLNNGPVLCVLTEAELAESVPSPKNFKQNCVSLAAGQSLNKTSLTTKLVKLGYERVRTVAKTGQIASRGSLLDIFSPQASRAVRLDFMGDNLESLGPNLKEAVVIPASLAGFSPTVRLAAYLEKTARLDINAFPPRADVTLTFSPAAIEELRTLAAPTPARSPQVTGKDLSFIKQLKTGQFVVHADHGIARFEGIVEQQTGDPAAAAGRFTGEYFKLLYAEGDKLFVPVTLAEKIEKYIGAANPALTRLSGGVWQKAVQKIRLDTLQEARELLNTEARRTLAAAPVIARDPELEKELSASFSYEETADQKQAIEAVYKDLNSAKPMDRLICGDVGFGKTEIAVRAAGKAALAGYQVALLSPTTILAQQHFDTFQERLKNMPLRLGSLTRFAPAAEQKKTVAALAAGKLDIVIGTHRLLSSDVGFKNLGLIIIDEEQRFGVEHKEVLKKMRSQAHVLTLTATPIPRTLHLSLSGVRDVSTIATAPAGRLPIETHIEPHNHTKIKAVLGKEIKRQGQAYYLYNKIESIELKKQELSALLPKASLGILHGQLPEARVAEVMHKFDKGEIDILVCSTIIENGLDLPNVNTLVVDNAVQFGLSQLHQIRGRIGRGRRQAFAYFFYKRQKLTGEAEKRLLALESARELGAGFDLAMRDMEIRGIGNILGKRQHGHVASVGLGLYLRLLREAVEEIQTGKMVAIIPDISVDLPIEARIPGFFEGSKEKRIELYHEWALIDDLDELNNVRTELAESGALPKALENLFTILRLKIYGRKILLKSIDTISGFGPAAEQTIVITPSVPLSPKQFARMLDSSPLWEYSTEEIKIKRADLGSDWLKKLEQSIKNLT